MNIHEYANIFPLLDETDLKALSKDIKDNGLQEPIVTYNNSILDGRNRYKACILADVEPKYIEYTGQDPLSYVISKNIHRRHLTESQRAIAAARIVNTSRGRPKNKEANLPINQISNNDASKKLNVSERSIKSAKKVLESKDNNLISAVESSGIPVSGAVELLSLPANQRQEAINKIVAGEYKNARQAAQKARRANIRASGSPNNTCKIRRSDAVSFINELPNQSVSCVCIDPPYGIEIHNTRNSQKQYADGKDYALNLLDQVCSALKPKLKSNAHLYIFCGYSNAWTFKQIISKYFITQDNPIVWVKNNHTLGNNTQKYLNKYELIWFAKNNEERILNNCSSDVLNYARDNYTEHTAEKPIELLKFLIDQSTVEGEIVCDVFVGSGSTAVAATQTNRQFVGCDIEQKWVDIAKGRCDGF